MHIDKTYAAYAERIKAAPAASGKNINSMEQINKDCVLAAIVRTFFKYFTAGVMESEVGTATADLYEPRNVKQVMLAHYDKIGQTFNSEAFYSIFRMNYEEDEIESVLRRDAVGNVTLMELMRTACRTDELYESMVSEYKRNFGLLLCGRIESQDEHERAYTRCPSAGTMNLETAENIVNRMAANAYARGRELSRAAR